MTGNEVGVNDLLDLIVEELAGEPGVTIEVDRIDTRVMKPLSTVYLAGARQVVQVEDVGRFSILVEECGPAS